MIGPAWVVVLPVLAAGAGAAAGRVGGGAGSGTALSRLAGAAVALQGMVPAVLALGAALLRLPSSGGGVGPGWLDDRLGRTMLVFALLPWLVVLILDGGERRIGNAVAAGGAALACLADGVFVVLIGLGCALLGSLPPRRWDSSRMVVPAVILGVAWFGTVLLSGAAGTTASWSRLAAVRQGGATAASGLLSAGTLMVGSAVLGALWWGLVAHDEPRRADRSAALVRCGMVGSVAACLLLRMLALLPDAPLATATVLLGCAMLGWAMLVMMARPAGSARRASAAATVLGGAALIGFSTGSGTGVLGGMLALFSLGTAYPMAVLDGSAWRRRAASAVLAGLPPFAPFAALLLVSERSFASSVFVAALLLVAVAMSGSAVLARWRRDRAPIPVSGIRHGAAAADIALLVLLLLGGLLLPPVVADWLLQFAPRPSGAGG